jgi:hypothetical protein
MSTWIKVGLIAVAIYGLLCVGLYAAMRQPPKVFGAVMSVLPAPAVMMGLPMRQLWQAARAGSVQAGDPAPDFDLPAVDRGSRVRLRDFRGVQPVVLVFGSYTCPPFRKDVPRINSIYHKYKDRAAFYLIYIQEAHPSDGWQLPSNVEAEVVFASPTSMEGRADLALACSRTVGIEFPALLDEISDSTEAAYTAWPSRICLVGKDGAVVYKSKPGPYGFLPDELEQALAKLLPG